MKHSTIFVPFRMRILEAIFEPQEAYNKQAFLDYVDNDFKPSEMDELIY